MKTRVKKCTACGHTMGITHAQYTQCPKNAQRNLPTPASPVTLSEENNTNRRTNSTIGTSLKMFHQTELDTTNFNMALNNTTHMTADDVDVMINLTEGLPQEQKTQIYQNMYDNMDTKGQVALVKKINLSDEKNYHFLTHIATDEKTARKVLKELRKSKSKDYVPYYVTQARNRSFLWRIWNKHHDDIKGFGASAGVGGFTGAAAGTVIAGPVGTAVGAAIGAVALPAGIFTMLMIEKYKTKRV